MMHEPLLDELPSGAYSVPSAAGSTTLQVSDQLLTTIVFLFALSQQQDLDRSIYYVPLLAAISLAIISLNAMQEWIRITSSRETYHRHHLTTVLSKLAMLAIAYLAGLFTRSIAAIMTSGPGLGHFALESLVPAIVVLVLLVVVIYHMYALTTHRVDIVRWLPALEH